MNNHLFFIKQARTTIQGLLMGLFLLFHSLVFAATNPTSLNTSDTYLIQDKAGQKWPVTTVTTPKELLAISKSLQLDSRIAVQDTAKRRSCLKGISLDSTVSSSQIFCIKKEGQPIGIATLLVSPRAHFDHCLTFKMRGSKLIVKPLPHLYPLSTTTQFLVEVGWLNILPKYRGRGLGIALISEVVVPAIKKIIHSANDPVLVICSAEGTSGKQINQLTLRAFNQYREKQQSSLSITHFIRSCLGQTSSDALFTPYMAEKMDLKRLEGVFNLSLGPVFANEFRLDS